MEPLFSVDLSRRLFSERSVLIGTFLGGPLVGAYLLSHNFKTLGQENRVAPTWGLAILAVVLVAATVFVPALDKIPAVVFSFLFCLAAHKAVRIYQGAALDFHREQGGLFYATFRAVVVGLVGLLLLMAFWFAITLLASQPV